MFLALTTQQISIIIYALLASLFSFIGVRLLTNFSFKKSVTVSLGILFIVTSILIFYHITPIIISEISEQVVHWITMQI